MLYILCTLIIYFFFFFNDTATTEIYTLSLHDALPISHHVGADHQPLDDLHRFGTSEVEGDATLVAVHRQEGRRHLPLRPHRVGELSARIVAFVRLDLHDVGAEQRQLVGPVRPREIASEVENADARERPAHDASRLVFATAFTRSNSLRRSEIFSGVSFARSR